MAAVPMAGRAGSPWLLSKHLGATVLGKGAQHRCRAGLRWHPCRLLGNSQVKWRAPWRLPSSSSFRSRAFPPQLSPGAAPQPPGYHLVASMAEHETSLAG